MRVHSIYRRIDFGVCAIVGRYFVVQRHLRRRFSCKYEDFDCEQCGIVREYAKNCPFRFGISEKWKGIDVLEV